MGLPGCGKSFFAQRLSQRLKIKYIGSDQIRKEMKSMGKYSMEEKLQVYEQMASLAKNAIQQGKSMILDATFFKEKLRNSFISLAQSQDVPYGLLWIEASERIIKERLSAKREDSEADYGVYLSLSKQFEEPTLPYLKLESKQDNIDQMLNQAEDYIHQLT